MSWTARRRTRRPRWPGRRPRLGWRGWPPRAERKGAETSGSSWEHREYRHARVDAREADADTREGLHRSWNLLTCCGKGSWRDREAVECGCTSPATDHTCPIRMTTRIDPGSVEPKTAGAGLGAMRGADLSCSPLPCLDL